MLASSTRRTPAGQKPSGVTLYCAAFLKHQDGSSRVRWSKRRARNSVSALDIFRLVARFRRTKRTTSLLPQATGTPSGAKRIDPKAEVFDHRANRPLLAQEGTAFHEFLDATRA